MYRVSRSWLVGARNASLILNYQSCQQRYDKIYDFVLFCFGFGFLYVYINGCSCLEGAAIMTAR